MPERDDVRAFSMGDVRQVQTQERAAMVERIRVLEEEREQAHGDIVRLRGRIEALREELREALADAAVHRHVAEAARALLEERDA